MKRHCSFIILSIAVLSLALPGILSAERHMLFEDLVTLNASETSFVKDVQDYTNSGLDFTIRGMVASRDPEGSFKGFRIDFNTDTTRYVTYQDVQEKGLFTLGSKGLKCKIKIVDYAAYMKAGDPLFGPDHQFTSVTLKIAVWTTE